MITDRKNYTIDPALLVNSVFTAGLMVIYFFVMKILGLNYVLEAHYFNILIIFGGMFYEIHRLSRYQIHYLEMIFTGLKVAFISSFLFCLFITIYLRWIDPMFMRYLKEFVPLGHVMTPWRIAVVLFIEQSAAGIICSLIIALAEGRSRQHQVH